VKESLDKAAAFLEKQHSFHIMFATGELGRVAEKRSPWVAQQLLHSVRDVRGLIPLKQEAVSEVLFHMEPEGVWRFWKFADPALYPDLNDTSCCLTALADFGVMLDYTEILRYLLTNRSPQGTFHTWLVDGRFGECLDVENDIDPVVNANALYLMSVLRERIPEVNLAAEKVSAFLIEQYMGYGLRPRSTYYDTPFAFAYAVSRAISRNETVKTMWRPFLEEFAEELKQELQLARQTPLLAGLALSSLLNVGYGGPETEELAHFITSKQKGNGGWGLFPLARDSHNDSYGSEALTAVLCIEALSRWLAQSHQQV
jgi:prenyltransferase beta subunit